MYDGLIAPEKKFLRTPPVTFIVLSAVHVDILLLSFPLYGQIMAEFAFVPLRAETLFEKQAQNGFGIHI